MEHRSTVSSGEQCEHRLVENVKGMIAVHADYIPNATLLRMSYLHGTYYVHGVS
jgi:hypothetical protein